MIGTRGKSVGVTAEICNAEGDHFVPEYTRGFHVPATVSASRAPILAVAGGAGPVSLSRSVGITAVHPGGGAPEGESLIDCTATGIVPPATGPAATGA
jgi:hypothetical protein